MRIALVQQQAGPDKAREHRAGTRRPHPAAAHGARLVCYAELAFEPFYPQNPATPEALTRAEPIPGPMTGRLLGEGRGRSASSWC